MFSKELVIYTVITEGHGQLLDPFPGDQSVKKICFTDNLSIENNGWVLVKLNNFHLDKDTEAFHPKHHPHLYLSDFAWSLYIDSSILFKENPQTILDKYKLYPHNFFCFFETDYGSLYDKAEVFIKKGYDERRIRLQMDAYKKAGYPEINKLAVTDFILRKHNDPDVIRLGEIWFAHTLHYSKCDQLAFNFLIQSLNFKCGEFDGSFYNNKQMEYYANDTRSKLPEDFDDQVYEWVNPEVSQSGITPRSHYISVGLKRGLVYSKKQWELDRLANKYKTDKGSIYYNAHSFAGIYQIYFEALKEFPIKLLEIGLLRHDVQARNPGGPYNDVPSINMWREYFPNAEIIGFDISDFSAVPAIANCKIIQGDMGKIKDLISLIETVGEDFDIIIDDASHASHHQQIAFGMLFQYLKPGGFYIIEDLNYQPPHLEKKETVKTKDFLWQLKIEKPIVTNFIDKEKIKYLRDNVEFIEFYDGLGRNFGTINQDAFAVIKKTKKENLFRPLT